MLKKKNSNFQITIKIRIGLRLLEFSFNYFFRAKIVKIIQKIIEKLRYTKITRIKIKTVSNRKNIDVCRVEFSPTWLKPSPAHVRVG